MDGTIIQFVKGVVFFPKELTESAGAKVLLSLTSWLCAENSDAVCIAVCEALAGAASFSHDLAQAIVDAGAVPALLQLLGQRCTSVRLAAMGCLVNIVNQCDSARKLVISPQHNGLHSIATMLADLPHEGCRNLACALLQGVSMLPSSDKHFTSIGLAKTIVRIAATSAEEATISSALGVLANVSCGSPETRTFLCGEGVVAHCIISLRRYSNPLVADPALRLLTSLMQDTDARVQVVAASGAGLIMDLLLPNGERPLSTCLLAACALRNLAMEDGVRATLCTAGATATIVKLIKIALKLPGDDSMEIIAGSMACLRNLAFSSEADVATRLYRDGALTTASALISDPDISDAVVALSCTAVANMCAFNDIVRLKCVEVKLIRPLLHVCQSQRHNACISAAAAAIKMVSLNGHARLKTSDLGGLPVLSALARHTCDAVALESVMAIRNLALSHVNRGYLCDCGGTRALAHVLLKHSNDSVVRPPACSSYMCPFASGAKPHDMCQVEGAAWAVVGIAESENTRIKCNEAGLPRALVQAGERCKAGAALEAVVSGLIILAEDDKIASQIIKVGGTAVSQRIESIGNTAARRLAKVLQGRLRSVA